MTDRRPALFQAYDQAAAVVSGVKPDQLREATCCSQYDVGALVDHIVGAGHRAATLGRGVVPPVGDFPHVELADAPEELHRASMEARSAWVSDSSLEQSVTMPWGELYSGATLVDMYVVELAAHSWDLAAATEQVAGLDQDLPVRALEAARDMLKPEYRNLMEEGSPFGSEVPAPSDATAWERFVAFTGRNPRPRRA